MICQCPDASLNFIGNVEARDLMDHVADVVVADGFTGDAVLKAMEGTFLMGIMSQLKKSSDRQKRKARLGAVLLKDSQVFESSLNYSTVLFCFGVQAPVVKTHGASDAKAVWHDS